MITFIYRLWFSRKNRFWFNLFFSVQNTSMMDHDKMCTFWNFTTNDWSDVGCRLVGIDDVRKTVTCSCDHMTNFAVMFSAIPPEGKTTFFVYSRFPNWGWRLLPKSELNSSKCRMCDKNIQIWYFFKPLAPFPQKSVKALTRIFTSI